MKVQNPNFKGEPGVAKPKRGCQEIAPETNQNGYQKGTLELDQKVSRNDPLSEPAKTPETLCFACVLLQKVPRSGSQNGARNGAKNDPEMDPEMYPKRHPKGDQKEPPSAIGLKVELL